MNKYIILFFLIFVFRSHGNKDVKIFGGYQCSITKNSFLVAILHGPNDKIDFLGGGTLISDYWVLTARNHLTFCNVSFFYEVVAGAQNTSDFWSKNEYVRSSMVERCYPSLSALDNSMEIALLRLAQPIFPNKRISYVRLALYVVSRRKSTSKLETTCKPALIMGYGANKFHLKGNSTIPYSNLYCAKIPAISEIDCRYKLPQFVNISTEFGCIFGANVSACHGDVGGPVMCRGIQLGILNTALKCGSTDPTPFIQIHNFQEFFAETLIDLGEALKSKCISNYFLNLFILLFSFIFPFINANYY